MIAQIPKPARKLVAAGTLMASSLCLAGCINFTTDFSGVPLDELDTSGAAPDEIALVGPDNIVLTVGETLDIQIEGDSEAQEKILFRLEGDSLAIGRDGDLMGTNTRATVRVTMPAPSEVSLAGSGDLNAETLADKAEISMAGSGKVTIGSLASDELAISSAGSGTVSGSGNVRSLEISIAGSGDIEFAEVTADDVDISIAGSGDIRFASDGTVDSSILGSGNVTVTGSATCETSAVGSGKVTCTPATRAAKAVDTEEAATTE